jgi:hypothetical protein
MPELKIVISSESNDPALTKIFVDDEQIGLVQRLRFEARAHNQTAYDLEIDFPPDAVLPGEGRQRMEHFRALVAPFLVTPPAGSSTPNPTSWDHIDAGLGIEDE